MRKSYILLIGTLLSCYTALAQEPVFSQYLHNRLEYNPSYAGADGAGRIRFAGMNRNQFNKIRGPFNVVSFSADYGICNLVVPFGLGLVVSNEIQGDGTLERTDAGFVLGYNSQTSGSSNIDFAFGLESSFIFQKVDWSKFTFSDQLDPLLGAVNQSTNGNVNIDYTVQPNFNFGTQLNFGSADDPFRIHFGAVASNLFEPSVGLLNGSKLYRRYSFDIALNKRRMFKKQTDAGRFVTNIRYDYQENYQIILINAEYYLVKNMSVGLGNRFLINKNVGRNSSSLLVQLGLTILKDVKIVISNEFVFINNDWAFTSELGFVYSPSYSSCKSKKTKNSKRRGSYTGRCPEF
jgi:type IX secretion system PorP/SprF family membrane protein